MKFVILIAVILLFFAQPAFAGTYGNYTMQWASSAIASSQFSTTDWSAEQATGEPNTFSCGDLQTAWAPGRSGTRAEWLKLSYSTPVYATEVNIYETNIGGFVYKVDLVMINETNHTIWSNTDNTACPGILNISFPTTSYKVKGIIIYTQINGYEEIDAVRLKGYQTYTASATGFYSLSASASAKRGEAVGFSVNVTNSELSINNVTAKISPPAGSLFDISMSLSSGNATSGIWSGSWTPGNTSAPGLYKVYYYACTSAACNSSSELSFILNSTLDLNASLKTQYLQGENIQITGYVKDFKTRETPAAVSLLLKSGSFSKIITKQSESSGKFSFDYKISLEDPAGDWVAIINATDNYNNTGNISLVFEVAEPVKAVGYTLDIIEPKDNAVLKRGDKIRITAVLKKDSERISGAQVTVKLPSGLLNLEETQPGVYSKEYSIPISEPVGTFSLAVEGQKGDLRGVKSISATIKSAELRIEPILESYKPGAEAEIKAKVSYQDGSAVTGEVFADFDGQKILLVKKDNYYSGTFVPQKEGTYSLRLEAKDEFGNTGSASTTITVGEMNIIDIITQYWYVTAAVLIAITLILHKTGKLALVSRTIRLRHLLSKEKSLSERRKRVQKQYFSEKKMDKHVYEKIINEVDSELLRVRGEIKKLRKL